MQDGSKSVSELSQELKIEQSKLSHALIKLKKCNLVQSKQKGKSKIYSLNKKTLVPILKLIDKHAKDFCNCDGCYIEECKGRK